MALTIKKKSGGSVVGKAGKKPSGPKWLKKGKAAQHLIEEEQRKEQAREERRGKMRRFWLPAKGDCTITFVDGHLDDAGMLDSVMYMEHNLQIGTSWKNWFVCVAEDEPCPICQDGVSNPYLAGALTVIEHDEFEFNGKLYRDQKRLFVFKKRTLELLLEYAKEYGGLAGCTFHVKRSSSDVTSVGDVFIFKKKRTIGELGKAYPAVEWVPADYEAEIPYYSGEDLRQMGYGSPAVGSEPEPTEAATAADDEL